MLHVNAPTLVSDAAVVGNSTISVNRLFSQTMCKIEPRNYILNKMLSTHCILCPNKTEHFVKDALNNCNLYAFLQDIHIKQRGSYRK